MNIYNFSIFVKNANIGEYSRCNFSINCFWGAEKSLREEAKYCQKFSQKVQNVFVKIANNRTINYDQIN